MILPTTPGTCAFCGKPVPHMSTRDRGVHYCSRVCATQARYRTRYVGSNSGPADRPTLASTLKL